MDVRRTSIFLLLVVLSCASVFAQETITDVKIKVIPESAEIRPLETAIVQIQFFGEKKKGFFDKILANEATNGQIQISDWNAAVKNSEGSLSKSFLLQNGEEKTKSGLNNFIKQGLSSVAAKDAVLFLAPAKTGKYTIKFTRGAVSKEIEINVSDAAASSKGAERAKFPSETKNSDPYFSLVEHYAPFVAQETWFEPKADYLARFDYDGNWRGDDNWENLEIGSSQAFVYYAVMETETHWFLIYNFFHPRDYSDFCVVGTCHENDNEGLIMTIRKDRSDFGKLEVMETLAHNNVYSYSNDSKIKKDIHDIDGKIEFYERSHPIIFIEAGGHGVFSSDAKQSLFSADKMEFKENTGVTYVFKGRADRPGNPNDRLVSYSLLPIFDEWWSKGNQQNESSNQTFENFFTYEPFGDRPKASAKYIAGAFHGRTASDNMAKPFWAWHDNKTRKKRVLNTGQWAMDPAYSVSTNLKFPKNLPFSLEYIFNPYLESRRTP